MNKKVLILGGFGFIGTNLTEDLIKRGDYEIIIFEAENVVIQNPDLTQFIINIPVKKTFQITLELIL